MSLYPWHAGLWRGLTEDRDTLPHALLLHGPQGVGKRAFAQELAKWLLCQAPTSAGACGACPACGWFGQGHHPDFRLIEPQAESDGGESEPGKKGGKFITIDEIRRLGEFLSLVSHQGGWRVVVLHPAESLNLAAANALLKTLEEPPSQVLLILISHQPGRLLPTVLSRCRKLPVPMPSLAQSEAWLTGQGRSDALASLCESGGAPLLALDYAEPERLARCRRFIAALSQPNDPALLDLGGEFQHRLAEAWGWLSRWVYDLLAVKAACAPRYFPDEGEQLRRLALNMSPVGLWELQQELTRAGAWLRHPLNAQLLLESWLLRYTELSGGR